MRPWRRPIAPALIHSRLAPYLLLFLGVNSRPGDPVPWARLINHPTSRLTPLQAVRNTRHMWRVV